MMTANQCRDRGVLAADHAAATDFPETSAAWEQIAHEWEMLATVAAVQHALIRPPNQERVAAEARTITDYAKN